LSAVAAKLNKKDVSNANFEPFSFISPVKGLKKFRAANFSMFKTYAPTTIDDMPMSLIAVGVSPKKMKAAIVTNAGKKVKRGITFEMSASFIA